VAGFVLVSMARGSCNELPVNKFYASFLKGVRGYLKAKTTPVKMRFPYPLGTHKFYHKQYSLPN